MKCLELSKTPMTPNSILTRAHRLKIINDIEKMCRDTLDKITDEKYYCVKSSIYLYPRLLSPVSTELNKGAISGFNNKNSINFVSKTTNICCLCGDPGPANNYCFECFNKYYCCLLLNYARPIIEILNGKFKFQGYENIFNLVDIYDYGQLKKDIANGLTPEVFKIAPTTPEEYISMSFEYIIKIIAELEYVFNSYNYQDPKTGEYAYDVKELEKDGSVSLKFLIESPASRALRNPLDNFVLDTENGIERVRGKLYPYGRVNPNDYGWIKYKIIEDPNDYEINESGSEHDFQN